MDLKSACERAGGRVWRDNVCIMGKNKVVQLDPFRYLVDTPYGTFKVYSSTVRLTEEGFYLPFNNCALEVTKDRVNIKCFAPAKNNELGVVFEETLSAAIGPT